MDKDKAIKALIKVTERNIGFALRTPSDFSMLSMLIRRKFENTVSTSTLKRLWGYVEYSSVPSPNTLNLLSRFNDYSDWETFVKDSGKFTEDDSSLYLTESLVISDSLCTGDVVTVEWFKDKKCVMEYIGDHRFRVNASANIKLLAGDEFTLYSLSVGLPMCVSSITRGSETIPGYVGARNNGVLTITIRRSNH